ncbi:MAG: IS200/IS605 family transposase [Candidatus Yonathbacteria bacterium]|nr:IS200/IS605 family transposase [Candidatus Yonathbacteria bacterium]
MWHFEWCTKYRYKIFHSEEMRTLCKIAIAETAKRHAMEILDYEVDIDHVHVVVSLPLTMTPARAMNLLKGCSARIIFHESPHLRRFYRKGHLWSPGKFMASVGYITLDKAKQYLEAHHAKTSHSKGNPIPLGMGDVKFKAQTAKLLCASSFAGVSKRSISIDTRACFIIYFAKALL